jgi:hypothetical protein
MLFVGLKEHMTGSGVTFHLYSEYATNFLLRKLRRTCIRRLVLFVQVNIYRIIKPSR